MSHVRRRYGALSPLKQAVQTANPRSRSSGGCASNRHPANRLLHSSSRTTGAQSSNVIRRSSVRSSPVRASSALRSSPAGRAHQSGDSGSRTPHPSRASVDRFHSNRLASLQPHEKSASSGKGRMYRGSRRSFEEPSSGAATLKGLHRNATPLTGWYERGLVYYAGRNGLRTRLNGAHGRTRNDGQNFAQDSLGRREDLAGDQGLRKL